MKDINKAAASLQRKLPVPRGAANTMALSGPKGPYLRVLIDPAYSRCAGIPSSFQGFSVVVEPRGAVVSFH